MRGDLTPAHITDIEGMPRNTVYRTMARLEDAKWLTSYLKKIPNERTRPRRFYKVTPLGRRMLSATRAHLAAHDELDVEPATDPAMINR